MKLTRRDREVLALLLRGGLGAKAIAGILEIAVSTAQDRINSLARRAGVARSDLILWAWQNAPLLPIRGAIIPRGLHPPDCPCGAVLCAVKRGVGPQSLLAA